MKVGFSDVSKHAAGYGDQHLFRFEGCTIGTIFSFMSSDRNTKPCSFKTVVGFVF